MKKCIACLNFKLKEEFTNNNNSPDGKLSKCKICKRQYEKIKRAANPKAIKNIKKKSYLKCKDTYVKYYINNKQKIDDYSRVRLLDITKKIQQLLGECKRRSVKISCQFDLDEKFITDLYEKQMHKCALTGIEFDFKKDPNFRIRPWAFSIDRINSKLGYTKDNIRLVCVSVNLAVNQFGDQIFDKICTSYVSLNLLP